MKSCLFAEQNCNCVNKSQESNKHRHKGHACKDAGQDTDESSQEEEQPHTPTRDRFRKHHFTLSLKVEYWRSNDQPK